NQLYLNTVRNSTYGIYLNYNCSYNDIYSNRISNNSNGVYLFNDCDNNSIYKNIIEKSSLSAVNIKISPASCDQNIFYENFFLTNAKHVIDLSGTNIWNNTQIGNYWDNYTGSDSNDDGIGDTPYVFSGGIDYLPIWDKSAPVITLNYPANNMRFGHSVPSFNVEITDLYLDKMWYQFIGHTKKFFFLSNGTFDTALWQSEWNSISDGDFISIRFYANDTPGNLASKDLQIIKDGFPIITILEPLDEAKVGRTAPNFVVDVDDYQIDSMWYSIDNGLNNFTFTTNTTIDQTAWQTFWDNLTDNDIITITFYAKDSLGQLSSKSVQVRVSVSTFLIWIIQLILQFVLITIFEIETFLIPCSFLILPK
ncbi:MAG: NosD domain-containing protein, partial [Candidatus Lokiarchaeota archaeon]